MAPRLKEAVRFVGFLAALSVVYGVLHDLVTAHVWTPYFTVHHPRLVESESPIVMALLWGFLATFWVGLIGGSLIAAANLVGNLPPVPWDRVRRWTVWAIAVLLLSAMVCLGGIYTFASIIPERHRRPTFETDRRAVAVALTHAWSYGAGSAAILSIAVATLVSRLRNRGQASDING